MIPKKIHYVWLGSAEMPELVRECIGSWKKQMPDYEIIRWDDTKIGGIDSIFVKEAIQMKKWAFASDYIRLYALYKEGGIYLDTDVMVFKSFDPFLGNRAFMGAENGRHVSRFETPRCLTSFCMGFEPNHPFIKDAMEYYEGRPFVRSRAEWLPEELKFEETVNSYILMRLAERYGYNPLSDKFPQYLKEGITVYSPEYFNPQNPGPSSYAEHRAEGSWREREIGGTIGKFKGKIRSAFLRGMDRAGFVIIKKR